MTMNARPVKPGIETMQAEACGWLCQPVIASAARPWLTGDVLPKAHIFEEPNIKQACALW